MTLRPAGEHEVVTAAGSVADLVDRVSPLPIETELVRIVESCFDDDCDWLVLVDAASRPVRLVERAALLRCEPFEHRLDCVPVAGELEAAARAAVARAPAERLRPLVGCDGAGRYVGLLRIERLLGALVA